MSYKSATIGLGVTLALTYVLLIAIFFLVLYPQLEITRKLGKAVQSAADNDLLCGEPGVNCDFVPDANVRPPTSADLDGTYNIPTSYFLAQAVAVLEDAVLNKETPLPLPNTQLIHIFSSASGGQHKDAADDKMQQMAWILVPTTQPDQVVIAFRGTQTKAGWGIDFDTALIPLDDLTLPGVLVHQGFIKAIDELIDDIVATLKSLLTPRTQILISGHSLGSSLAILCALRLAQQGISNLHLYVFAPPRVGNDKFVRLILSLIPTSIKQMHAVANVADIIPQVPLSVHPNLDAPDTPLLYAQFPLLMFQDNWGSWVHNHILPVYIENLNRVVPVSPAPDKLQSRKQSVFNTRRKRPNQQTTAMLRKFLFSI